MGLVAFVAALLTMLLPDTRGKHLPETIDAAEEFTKLWVSYSHVYCKHYCAELAVIFIIDYQKMSKSDWLIKLIWLFVTIKINDNPWYNNNVIIHY